MNRSCVKHGRMFHGMLTEKPCILSRSSHLVYTSGDAHKGTTKRSRPVSTAYAVYKVFGRHVSILFFSLLVLTTVARGALRVRFTTGFGAGLTSVYRSLGLGWRPNNCRRHVSSVKGPPTTGARTTDRFVCGLVTRICTRRIPRSLTVGIFGNYTIANFWQHTVRRMRGYFFQ